jgi:hypothetical protein
LESFPLIVWNFFELSVEAFNADGGEEVASGRVRDLSCRSVHADVPLSPFASMTRPIRLATVLRLMAALTMSRTAGAQVCTPSANPLFEYQVDHPAFFVGDTTIRPRFRGQRISQAKDQSAIRIAIVIDSLGHADPKLLHLLQAVPASTADSVRVAMASWRFTPATASGCHVAQLVTGVFER